MTMQKSIPEKKHNAKRSYFAFLLRQNWPAMVTNTIILVLINVVWLSMVLSNEVERPGTYEMMDFFEIAHGMRVINAVFASFLAVLWGSTAMNYVNSKVSVNFYHSLPLTRGFLYISEIAVKLISFAVPSALSLLVSLYLNGSISGFWDFPIVYMYLTAIGYALLCFLFFFSIMVFASSFTGNPFSRLMSAGLIVAMPSVLILCFVTILEYSAYFTSYDTYLNFALEIFTPARIIMFLTGEGDLNTSAWREIAGFLLASVLFLAAGYAIYRRRKSELSGTPVLSRIASVLIKYSCMFCAAALFSLICHTITDSVIWYCIGAVIGLLLSMMLLNVILTKSSKQMFSGIRGMSIFAAAYIALFVCFGMDVFGIDRHIPSPAMCKDLTVSVDGEVNLTIENKEDREFLLKFLEEYMEDADVYAGSRTYNYDVYAEAEKWGYTFSFDEEIFSEENGEAKDAEASWLREIFKSMTDSRRNIHLSLIFEPRIGIPVEKTMYVNHYAFREFLARIADTENFADEYFRMDELEEKRVESAEQLYIWGNGEELTEAKIKDIIRTSSKTYSGSEYFQRTAVNYLYCRAVERGELYNYAGSRYLHLNIPYFDAPASYMEEFIASVSTVYVLNHETMQMQKFSAADEIRQICSNITLENGSYSSSFTESEENYTVAVVYGTDDGDEFYAKRYDCAFFLAGKVPGFVK